LLSTFLIGHHDFFNIQIKIDRPYKPRQNQPALMVILGNDVIIAKEDGTSFRIVPFAQPYPKFGSANGLIEISDDFDEPVEGFEEYMP